MHLSRNRTHRANEQKGNSTIETWENDGTVYDPLVQCRWHEKLRGNREKLEFCTPRKRRRENDRRREKAMHGIWGEQIFKMTPMNPSMPLVLLTYQIIMNVENSAASGHTCVSQVPLVFAFMRYIDDLDFLCFCRLDSARMLSGVLRTFDPSFSSLTGEKIAEKFFYQTQVLIQRFQRSPYT